MLGRFICNSQEWTEGKAQKTFGTSEDQNLRTEGLENPSGWKFSKFRGLGNLEIFISLVLKVSQKWDFKYFGFKLDGCFFLLLRPSNEATFVLTFLRTARSQLAHPK